MSKITFSLVGGQPFPVYAQALDNVPDILVLFHSEQTKVNAQNIERCIKQKLPRLVVQLVETIAKRSKEIEDASREVSGNAENCQKAIHAIEEMSRNVVSNSETVSAATEEQAASIHEMAISSQQLSEMATSLQKEVAHFKV